ncbi:DNA polymerase epsilon subunit B [Fusarium oxysporum f. sp. albedinis]|nr:DNA polymerase epsilon subunit B [Fusarium oxysporum f. sp. albedinis]
MELVIFHSQLKRTKLRFDPSVLSRKFTKYRTNKSNTTLRKTPTSSVVIFTDARLTGCFVSFERYEYSDWLEHETKHPSKQV